jgi:hypothetical protein
MLQQMQTLVTETPANAEAIEQLEHEIIELRDQYNQWSKSPPTKDAPPGKERVFESYHQTGCFQCYLYWKVRSELVELVRTELEGDSSSTEAPETFTAIFVNPDQDVPRIALELQRLGWISESGKWLAAKNRIGILFDVLKTKDKIRGVTVQGFYHLATLHYQIESYSDGTARIPAYDSEKKKEDRTDLLTNL